MEAGLKPKQSPCWACNNLDAYWQNKLASQNGSETSAEAAADDSPAHDPSEEKSHATEAPIPVTPPDPPK